MKNLIDLFAKGYEWLAHWAGFLKSPLLLFIRIAWGWQTFESGRGHLSNYSRMVDLFTGWHVPFPQINVYISGYTEEILGIVLIAGFASRLITIPLMFNFLVAYLVSSDDSAVSRALGIFTKPDDFFNDTAFPFLVASLIIFILGPGVFSLDWVIGWSYRKKKAE